MKLITIAFTVVILSLACVTAHASEDCRTSMVVSMNSLKDVRIDPETRAQLGVCLLRHFSDKNEVANMALKIIRDPEEDLLFREDLIESIGNLSQRKKNKLEQNLGPKQNAEKENLKQGSLSALSQAAKSMEEYFPPLRMEGEFMKTFAEIAQGDANHIQLRNISLNALKSMMSNQISNGGYDEKAMKAYLEVVQQIAAKNDNSSFFSGAELVYRNITTQLGSSFSSNNVANQQEKDSKRGLATPAKMVQ